METTTTTTISNEEIIAHIMGKANEMMDEKTQAYIDDICEQYGNRPIVRKILTLYQLDYARKEIQQSIMNDIYTTFGKLPKDCKELVEMLQDMDLWPKTFGSPLSIYNRLLERKKGGSDSKWFEKDSYIQHMDKSEKVHCGFFAAVLNMCRNISKEKSNFEIQQRERKRDVMALARKILDAAKRGDRDEIEVTLPAFRAAKDKAESVLVEYTDAEQDTVESVERGLYVVKVRKKDSAEQLQALEARAKAAEEAKKEAEEARKEAEQQAIDNWNLWDRMCKTAEKAAEEWETEREKLRRENAETQVRLRETADKYNRIQALAHNFTHKPSKKELEDFLKQIQEITK